MRCLYMCTAATYKTKDFYMGRTLDYEFSYSEEIAITPRNYEFDFRHAGKLKRQLTDLDIIRIQQPEHLRRTVHIT